MHIPPLVLPLIVSIAVYMDAKAIGVKKGLLPGFFNMGAGLWALACFLFLIIALPAYLFKRSAYIQAAAHLKAHAVLEQQRQASIPTEQVWPPPPQMPPGRGNNTSVEE